MDVQTTRGLFDESALARTVGLEDRPTMYALWIEWRLGDELVRRDAFPLPKEVGPMVYTVRGDLPIEQLERVVELSDTAAAYAVAVVWKLDGVLVRRDAHVVMKEPSVTATGVAATL